MDAFLTLAGCVLAAASAAALAVWRLLAPVLVRQFERRLESYAKQRDVEDVDRKLEMMKDEVARARFEHETRFSALHERRALVIADVYAACVDAEEAFTQLTALLTPGEWAPETAFEKAGAARDALQRFERVGLFLPRASLPVLRATVKALDEIGAHVRYVKSTTGGGQESFRTAIESLQVHGKVKRWLPYLRASLDEAFREALGDAPAPSTQEPALELPDAVEIRTFAPTVTLTAVEAVEERPQAQPTLPAPGNDDKSPT